MLGVAGMLIGLGARDMATASRDGQDHLCIRKDRSSPTCDLSVADRQRRLGQVSVGAGAVFAVAGVVGMALAFRFGSRTDPSQRRHARLELAR